MSPLIRFRSISKRFPGVLALDRVTLPPQHPVNAICCGTVDTPIVHASARASGDPDAYWQMLRRGHPVGRITSADDVATFYVYMASDHASFFTGAILMMDGGHTAQ